MIDWIMYPTHSGNLLYFYLYYLTLLCFGIGDYNHTAVVNKSLR